MTKHVHPVLLPVKCYFYTVLSKQYYVTKIITPARTLYQLAKIHYFVVNDSDNNRTKLMDYCSII